MYGILATMKLERRQYDHEMQAGPPSALTFFYFEKHYESDFVPGKGSGICDGHRIVGHVLLNCFDIHTGEFWLMVSPGTRFSLYQGTAFDEHLLAHVKLLVDAGWSFVKARMLGKPNSDTKKAMADVEKLAGAPKDGTDVHEKVEGVL